MRLDQEIERLNCAQENAECADPHLAPPILELHERRVHTGLMSTTCAAGFERERRGLCVALSAVTNV
jgi:hypothetical protein